MTYRDLVRRSQHPHARGRAHRVTNPAAGYLPEPRTRADSYDTDSRAPAERLPALPYAGTADGTDWAIREWAVRVWAARDHGPPQQPGDSTDTGQPRPLAGPDAGPVDWESLDADSFDASARPAEPAALSPRRHDSQPAHWLDDDPLAPVPGAPDGEVTDDDLDALDELSELLDADDPEETGNAAGYRRPSCTRETPPAPAGPPPPQLYAAAILTAVLSLPLLLSAGVLVAVAAQSGITAVMALFLAIAAVVGAACDVVAALRLADRGDPGLARVGGYTTLAGTVLSAGWLLLGGGAANVLFPIWASFGVLAIAMFALLGTGSCRDWLATRERERHAAGRSRRR